MNYIAKIVLLIFLIFTSSCGYKPILSAQDSNFAITNIKFVGDKSIVSYFMIKNQQIQYKTELDYLKKQNEYYLNRIKRLQTNSIDLDFLDGLKTKS